MKIEVKEVTPKKKTPYIDVYQNMYCENGQWKLHLGDSFDGLNKQDACIEITKAIRSQWLDEVDLKIKRDLKTMAIYTIAKQNIEDWDKPRDAILLEGYELFTHDSWFHKKATQLYDCLCEAMDGEL